MLKRLQKSARFPWRHILLALLLVLAVMWLDARAKSRIQVVKSECIVWVGKTDKSRCVKRDGQWTCYGLSMEFACSNYEEE